MNKQTGNFGNEQLESVCSFQLQVFMLPDF